MRARRIGRVAASCRRGRLARLLRTPRPAVLPAIWLQVRLWQARRRHPGALIRPSTLSGGRCQPRRRRFVRSNRLRWQVHLVGWLLAAVPAVLLSGWAWLPAAPAAFEAVLLAATLRPFRVTGSGAGPGPGPDGGPWPAGDRHPRTPLPRGGSGAAALPLP